MKMDNALSSETLNSVPKKNKRKKKNRKTLVPTEDEVTPLETEANVNAKLVPRKEEAAQLEIEPDVDTKLVTKEETTEFETEADVNTKLEPTSEKKKRGKRKRHRRDDETKMDSTDHESVSMKSSVSEGDLHPESVVGINGEMNLERCPSESVVNNESAASGELGPTPRKKKRKKRSKSNSTEINNIEHENLNGATVESTVKESEEQLQDGSDQTGVERTQNLESSTPNEDLSCSKVKEKKKKKGEKRKNKKNRESDDKVSESLEGTDMENVVLDKIESVQPSGKASARTESEAEQMDHALQQNVGMLSQAVTHAKHLAKDCGNFVTEVAGLNSTDTKEKSPVTDEHNGFPIGVDSGSIKKRDDYIDALESKEIETYKRKKRNRHKKKRKSSELEDTTQSVEDNDVNNTSSHCLVEADASGLPENIETRMDEKESDSVNHSDINPASQVRKKVKTMSTSGGTTCRNKYLNDASELDVSEEGNEQKNRGVLAKEHDALKLDAIEIEITREEAPSLHSVKVKDGVHLDSTTKEANLLQIPETLPERTLVARSRRKLLILDVNGLLVDFVSYPSRQFRHDITISKKYVYKRPYCDEFLEFCFDKFNVGVWSSRMKSNMEKVIDFLFKDSKQKLLFCWDQSHCTATGFNTLENRSKPLVFKELRKLWEKLEPDLPFERGYYDETNTLLLDDTPYKALRNPANTAIFPKSYQHCDRRDNSLGPGGDLRTYLEGLAMTDDVRKYVENNPFGQEAITKSHKSWEFYSKLL